MTDDAAPPGALPETERSPFRPSEAALCGGWCGAAGPLLALLTAIAVSHVLDPPAHAEFDPVSAAIPVALFATLPGYAAAVAGEGTALWLRRRRGGPRTPAWGRFGLAFAHGTALMLILWGAAILLK